MRTDQIESLFLAELGALSSIVPAPGFDIHLLHVRFQQTKDPVEGLSRKSRYRYYFYAQFKTREANSMALDSRKDEN